MMNRTKIEWCDYTWNPVTGCLHGCKYCYARRITERFGKKMPDFSMYPKLHKNCHMIESQFTNNPFPFIFEPSFHAYRLDEPKRIKKPSRVFAVSMGDLFGEWVPDEWIKEVFEACAKAPQHQYIFLTKNPRRYGIINGRWYNYQCNWPENCWFGTSITCQSDTKRILNLPYGNANTFISIEPLQEHIDLSFYLPKQDTKWKCSFCGHHANRYTSHCQNCNKEGGYCGSLRKQPVNWIIVGAQTGPAAVKPKPEWIQAIINEARARNIPLFLKDNLKWLVKIQEFPTGR